MTLSGPLGIAQYIPASARAMSNTSTVLFMGEASQTQILRGRSICLRKVLWGLKLWITLIFSSLLWPLLYPGREFVPEDLRSKGGVYCRRLGLHGPNDFAEANDVGCRQPRNFRRQFEIDFDLS